MERIIDNYGMSDKKTYASPRIIREVKRETGATLMAGSVVTPNAKIETAGQGVENHDFSTGYDNNWE